MEDRKYIFKVVKARFKGNRVVDEVVALVYNNKNAVVEIIREILNDNFGRDPDYAIEMELYPLDFWGVSKDFERLTVPSFVDRFFPGILNRIDETGGKTN